MAEGKVVECVPNFSEGRNGKVIEAIADAVSGTEGCLLLDVDSGESTNRTVYTFVGAPSAVVQGALAAARVAFKLIDMTKHKGGWGGVGVRGAGSPGTQVCQTGSISLVPRHLVGA